MNAPIVRTWNKFPSVISRFYSNAAAEIQTHKVYTLDEVTPTASSPLEAAQVEKITNFITSKRKLLVITGAGSSTESGVPDYRSPNGSYSKGHKPTTYQEFVGKPLARQRYWARSMVGHQFFSNRQPNPTHTSLAVLEREGYVHYLITQNVDRLHHKAGHQRVIELHGNNATVFCMSCRQKMTRSEYQDLMLIANPMWQTAHVNTDKNMNRPDGDINLGEVNYAHFTVPGCPHCGGLMKPEVVFFGENVPLDVVKHAMEVTTQSDGVLVIGTSLQVYSIFRFLKAADTNHIPIGIINIGPTRGDDLPTLQFKVEARSGEVLPLVISKMFVKTI